MNPIEVLKSFPPTPKRRPRWRLGLTIVSPVVLALAALSYCGFAKVKYGPIAAVATDTFHRQFTLSQDSLIYSAADKTWTTAIDADTQHRFFARIRRKLGKCSYNGPLSWNANTGSTGTYITLIYQAQCANGPMNETFVWRINSGRSATLVAYQANSKLLLPD